ncbi:hypothetical protein MTO96_020951 [Rhipicephalus appendiculatus]
MQMSCAVSRRMQKLVRRGVVFIWSLLALCVLNYAVLRYCVSDMRWHVRQRDQTRIVVGPGRFPALPHLRCPDFLAIVVCSAVDHFEQRAVVRDTWARDAASGRSSVFFLIGFADNTPSGAIVQERVANEIALYGDIIQADFRDTYRNLTLKSVFLLKWAFMYCSRAQFLMKTDDDVFVNVPNMANLLTELQSAKRRTGQDNLPLYGSGTGYVMSYDAVRPLFTEALLTPFLYVEDIFHHWPRGPEGGHR